MHAVAIAWMFVVLLMTLAEATSTQGTVLGALFTLLLYGLLPLGLVLYLMGTPMRRGARRAAEAAERAEGLQPDAEATVAEPEVMAITPSSGEGHRGGEATGSAIAPERKEA